MDDEVFNRILELRLAIKRLNKQGSKLEKDSLKSKESVRQCLQKGEAEKARIYAEKAVRQHNEAMKLLTLCAKLEGVKLKVEQASKNMEIGKHVVGFLKQINAEDLQTTNIESALQHLERNAPEHAVQVPEMPNSIHFEKEIAEMIDQTADNSELEKLAALSQLPSVPQEEEPSNDNEKVPAKKAKTQLQT